MTITKTMKGTSFENHLDLPDRANEKHESEIPQKDRELLI
jgi:hypothetical protein